MVQRKENLYIFAPLSYLTAALQRATSFHKLHILNVFKINK
jgi:hypothetical protein